MATSGSIESVALNGRNFAVAADAESNRKLGGFENETQANGDGSFRTIKTRVTSVIDGLSIVIDDARGDQEFVQRLIDDGDSFPVVVAYASGLSYTGAMTITGELQVSSQNGTAPITLMGGKLTKQ